VESRNVTNLPAQSRLYHLYVLVWNSNIKAKSRYFLRTIWLKCPSFYIAYTHLVEKQLFPINIQGIARSKSTVSVSEEIELLSSAVLT